MSSSTSQWFIKPFNNAAISTLVAQSFFPPSGGDGESSQTIEILAHVPWPANGRFTTLAVRLDTAPGAGKSYRFQITVNAVQSTVLDTTITDPATTGTVTGSVIINAGDLVSISIIPSGTPAATAGQISLEWEPTTLNEYCYVGHNLNNLASTPLLAPLMSRSGAASANDVLNSGGGVRSYFPFDGTLTAFYVALTAAPGTAASGKSSDSILTKNGVELSSTDVLVFETATANHVSSLGIPVAGGDYLSFKLKTLTNTPASARYAWGVVVVPNTPGLFAIQGAGTSTITTSNYFFSTGTDLTAQVAEGSAVEIQAPANLWLHGLVAAVGASPGAGKSWTITDNINSSPGTMSAVISNANLTGSDYGHIDAITPGQTLDVLFTAAGTPTTTAGQAWAIGASTSLQSGSGGGKGGGKNPPPVNPPPPPPAGVIGTGGRVVQRFAHNPNGHGRTGAGPMVSF